MSLRASPAPRRLPAEERQEPAPDRQSPAIPHQDSACWLLLPSTTRGCALLFCQHIFLGVLRLSTFFLTKNIFFARKPARPCWSALRGGAAAAAAYLLRCERCQVAVLLLMAILAFCSHRRARRARPPRVWRVLRDGAGCWALLAALVPRQVLLAALRGLPGWLCGCALAPAARAIAEGRLLAAGCSCWLLAGCRQADWLAGSCLTGCQQLVLDSWLLAAECGERCRRRAARRRRRPESRGAERSGEAAGRAGHLLGVRGGKCRGAAWKLAPPSAPLPNRHG